MSLPPESTMAQRQAEIYIHSRTGVRRDIAVNGAVVGLGLLAVVMGWLVASGHLLIALLPCVALPIALVVAWLGPAAIAGIILLLALDGVPGVNLASFDVHGSFEAVDICALALILLAAARYFLGARDKVDQRSRQLAVWSALFVAVWMLAFFKGLDRGVPALKAALFGRDFLFFALLVPMAKALVKNERELTRLVAVVGTMTTIYALGEIATSLRLINPSIINVKHTLAVGPFTRVYGSMNDLVALGFCCALAYALLNSGKRARWAATVAAVCGVAVILQLTRALYVGLVAGMVLAFILWATGRSRRSRLRRRLLWTVSAIVVLSAVTVFVAPQVLSSSSVQTITNRVNEGISDVGSSSQKVPGNTVAYRQNVSSLMLQVLGSHWVFGLGFLHPSAVYFPQLPNGSIRNNDLGLFNGLMTMGVIGDILIYVPVLMALRCVLPRQAPGARDWLRLGGMIWIVSVIVGSLTLVTLFSPTGLILMAVLLGIVFRDAQERSYQGYATADAPRSGDGLLAGMRDVM
jgi:O-antigen ligase/polysaccharide polymerase Wzy-like membrane protein